jgi:hypothetical protein
LFFAPLSIVPASQGIYKATTKGFIQHTIVDHDEKSFWHRMGWSRGTEQNFDHNFACCSFHLSELKFLATGVLTAKSPEVKSKRGADAAGRKCSGPQL